jgi:peptidoglycan/LPS O-acetylase OafA/YrhL
MSMIVALVIERVSVRVGLWLFAPLLVLGISSVGYWRFTELEGRGDYRFYLFVEFFPAIVLGMIVALFSPKFTRTYDLAIAFSFFVLAKLFELFDQQTYSFFGIVSCHTLKHLIAGFCILRMLILRRPVCYNSGLN